MHGSTYQKSCHMFPFTPTLGTALCARVFFCTTRYVLEDCIPKSHPRIVNLKTTKGVLPYGFTAYVSLWPLKLWKMSRNGRVSKPF